MSDSSALRLAKFAAVGVVGIGVQLAALKGLVAIGWHYLAATACAVEFAVLHNFVWHQRFTWRDRVHSRRAEAVIRLLRFHVSNGAISIGGSLLLMRWLVGGLRLPILPANLITIAVCSVANFLAGDRWVFLSGHGKGGPAARSPIKSKVRWANGT